MRTYGIIGFSVGMFFLLITPTVIPSAYTSVALKDSQQESTMLPEEIFCGTTEMPDLIIEDLLILPGSHPFEESFECQVKNIGDTLTPPDKFIYISVTVRWKIFGLFPLIPIREFRGGTIGSGLAPGEIVKITFAGTANHMPLFGFYSFYCMVNPEHIIDESNNQNNVYTETVLFILGLTLNSWF